MPKCLKCGAELVINEEGVAPVLCDVCAGVASKRARRFLYTGTLRDYPVTTLLMTINISIFIAMVFTGAGFIHLNGNALLRWGGNYGPYTTSGEYWRLVTSCFLHGGIIHVGMNMWCLSSLGSLSERLFGRWQTLCIYLVTGVGGALLSIAYLPTRFSVGASGALFGIAGAILAAIKQGDLPITAGQKKALYSSMVMFLILSFTWGAQSGIDNMAHLGGFITGLIIGLPLGAFARKNAVLQVAILLVTSGVLVAAGRELAERNGAEGLLMRADDAYDRKNYAKTVHLLEEYRARKPDDVDALVWLGNMYLREQDRTKASAAFRQALLVNPESEDAKDGLEELGETPTAAK
jgi:membrane associated rhomboid family serine protease